MAFAIVESSPVDVRCQANLRWKSPQVFAQSDSISVNPPIVRTAGLPAVFPSPPNTTNSELVVTPPTIVKGPISSSRGTSSNDLTSLSSVNCTSPKSENTHDALGAIDAAVAPLVFAIQKELNIFRYACLKSVHYERQQCVRMMRREREEKERMRAVAVQMKRELDMVVERLQSSSGGAGPKQTFEASDDDRRVPFVPSAPMRTSRANSVSPLPEFSEIHSLPPFRGNDSSTITRENSLPPLSALCNLSGNQYDIGSNDEPVYPPLAPGALPLSPPSMSKTSLRKRRRSDDSEGRAQKSRRVTPE